MKNANIRLTCALLASAALTGCYAQIEDGTVSLTHQLCTAGSGNCLPGSGVPLALANLVPPFDIDLGDSGVLNHSETTQGPVKFKTVLALNRVVLTTDTIGASFDQVSLVNLVAVLNGDSSCANPSNCPVIARYDVSSDGPAAQTLVLESDGLNLLDVTNGSRTLSLLVKATGFAPNPPVPGTWNASAEFVLSLKSRASYP
jgi:hypothetical protein